MKKLFILIAIIASGCQSFPSPEYRSAVSFSQFSNDFNFSESSGVFSGLQLNSPSRSIEKSNRSSLWDSLGLSNTKTNSSSVEFGVMNNSSTTSMEDYGTIGAPNSLFGR
ncbi:hypothetical protein [Candidatus Uabimicrobium amorphum]|uniref:Lipoprotein n=1 Tax=Uabimicrobium amorphum TaxID=2596890 RepID=A0A5S9IWP4_UABAM|nr:hypothetical protein [Candidatus Uabimicrobium amorphum]BBM87915.1 hypothetical protein UABAM_06330 [Candidatus Uabimicrobium amorphum]